MSTFSDEQIRLLKSIRATLTGGQNDPRGHDKNRDVRPKSGSQADGIGGEPRGNRPDNMKSLRTTANESGTARRLESVTLRKTRGAAGPFNWAIWQ